MTEAFYIHNMDGIRIQNFIPTRDGAMRRVAADYNGFAVSYHVAEDDEGKLYLRPALSIICCDLALSETLQGAGLKILPHLPCLPFIEEKEVHNGD